MNTAIITLMVSLLVLLQSDIPEKNNTVEIIKAVGGVIAIIGGILSPIILFYVNKMSGKVNAVATKVDGLMEEKTLADKALGRIEGIDTAAKEKAIGDDRELKIIKEQQLRDQIPASVSTVKDKIIEAVEIKADETKDVVEKIPDEVVKKLPPS